MTATTATNIVWPTLVVIGFWVVSAAMIAGAGYVTRRVLAALWGAPITREPDPADFWLGMASLTAFLLFWSLGAEVDWRTWLIPLAVGGIGICLALVALRSACPNRPSWVVLVVLGGTVAWVANRCLSPFVGYDLGLYHLAAIDFASRSAAIPGLANFHERLGAANGHLLFASFLGSGPMSGIAFHLVNGLLISALLVDVVWRFRHFRQRPRAPSFTRRVALLLVPATLVVVSVGMGSRLAGPDLDVAAFVFVAIGMLYLVQCVEVAVTPVAAATSTAAFALAGSTRPLFWPLVAYGAVVVAICGGASATQKLRRVLVVLALPTVLLLGWLIRQAVLSGYPLYPASVGGLPVDWRVAAESARAANRVIASWSRLPGGNPEDVLSSWGWLGSWMRQRAHDRDIVAPGLFVVGACIAAACGRDQLRSRSRSWSTAMLAVVIPSFVVLVIWFFTAPDPRFVLAPIWLIPIALLAWALPSRDLPSPRRLKALTLGILVGALTVTAVTLAQNRMLRPIVSDGDGPLGTQPMPRPALVAFRTRSGLEIFRPLHGDQCWQAYLCTPRPLAGLRLRGRGVASGFRVDR